MRILSQQGLDEPRLIDKILRGEKSLFYLQKRSHIWYTLGMSNQLKNTIIIPAAEYDYLKKIEQSFERFFGSFAHLKEIERARKEIKQKKYLSQEAVFKKLGL